jgi:hypothetical protein
MNAVIQNLMEKAITKTVLNLPLFQPTIRYTKFGIKK